MPIASWPLAPDDWQACKRILGHSENFPVLTVAVPRKLRRHVAVLYAWCRSTDDLGDEGPGDRRKPLDRRESDLRDAWDGRPVADPVVRATVGSAHHLGLPIQPYLDLITANRMDQETNRYETFEDLRHYCRRSADPVGRLYLRIHGFESPELDALSDHNCTGLQIVNFLQDVEDDLVARDRVYIPFEDLLRYRVDEHDLRRGPAGAAWPRIRAMLDFQRARAAEHLRKGRPLADLLGRRLGTNVRVFADAGLAVIDACHAVDGDTWNHRPTPSRTAKTMLVIQNLGRLLLPSASRTGAQP